MSERFWNLALKCTERGWVPDAIIRAGIRQLCRKRLQEQQRGSPLEQAAARRQLLDKMAAAPIAPLPHKANEQHYEAPPELFVRALGPHLKYSCCYWPENVTSLARAEEEALRITCERAEIEDGLEILELGCGWGSLSLWMAERYPASRILAVSNSRTQRLFIEKRATKRGLDNLEVITADMNDFSTSRRFDRVVSVEMLEHLRNYTQLLESIAEWMRPEAKLFVHVFCHRQFAYEFETEGASDWLGRHFFTGGLMPSEDLLLHFHHRLSVTRQWRWSGTHYQKTANAWLANLDAARPALLPVFRNAYPDGQAEKWFQRWRMFFMACAELWGFRGGEEWFVSHYLLEKARSRSIRVPFSPAVETSKA